METKKILIKLTPLENKAVLKLYQHRNGTVRPYLNPKGERCMRLMDHTISPVYNIPAQIWESLRKEGVITLGEGGTFTVNEAYL